MNILQKNAREKEIVHTAFLFSSIGILLTLTFFFFLPFLSTLFMAAIIATVTSPVVDWLRTKGLGRGLAVTSVFIGVILLIIIPSIIFTSSLLDEAVAVSGSIVSWSQNLPENLQKLVLELPFVSEDSGILEELDFSTVNSMATDLATKLSGTLVSSATVFATKLATLLLHLVIFFIALFFLLIDGQRIINYVKRLIPLNPAHTNELFDKNRDLMESIVYGMIGGALAQGLMLGIGMSIVGVENPIFWATLAAIISPIPFGVTMVWLPMAISLFVAGEMWQGVVFLIWSATIVANIDNFVKPILIGNRSSLHPFAVMIVLLGGVFAFGFKGLIFGPLVLTLLLAFLHIYELEYRDAPPKPKPKPGKKPKRRLLAFGK